MTFFMTMMEGIKTTAMGYCSVGHRLGPHFSSMRKSRNYSQKAGIEWKITKRKQ